LFSNDEVAAFIHRNFEAVWESVRPVPLVQIDFGGGTKIIRTLHGNIATYLCNADGHVLDVLPGIYTPNQYLQSLSQFQMLAGYVAQRSLLTPETRLQNYHRAQADALKNRQAQPQLVRSPYISKLAIENPIKLVLASAAGNPFINDATAWSAPAKLKLDTEDLANWKLLAEDTKINESQRRRQIHERLAGKANVRPTDLTKWLYREVLHADLDDPYLGLGSVLFANYPFKDKVR